MSKIDRRIEHVIEIGERNAEVVQLIQNHCRHARVERFGGVGLVEVQTGLPIGMRTVGCEHASTPSMAGMNLDAIALGFYENNCVGCPHRDVVNVPNLATLAAERAAERDAAEHRRQEADEREAAARAARRDKRIQRMATEGAQSRRLVELLNTLDDAQPTKEAGGELAATILANPALVTPGVGELLVEAAVDLTSEAILEAVRYAARGGRIERRTAIATAVETLAHSLSSESARILLEFRHEVGAQDLGPATRWLIIMVGRRIGPMLDYSPDRGAAQQRAALWGSTFLLLVERDLAGTLTTIEEMLAADEDYDRERAAAAAEVLVGIHPEVIPVLAHQLVAAIGRPGSIDDLNFDHKSSETITGALAAALLLDPAGTSHAVESGAAALDDEQRDALFRTYDRTIRQHRDDAPIPSEPGDAVVDACLRRLAGDWGEEARRQASDTLELVSKWHGYLLEGKASALLSLLMEQIGLHEREPTLQRPSGPFEELDRMSASIGRNARINHARKTLGNLAQRQPREVLESAEAFLRDQSIETEEARQMRAQCVVLLGDLGKRSDVLADVIPFIYTAIVSSDQLIRRCAIDALQEIARAHPPTVIPSTFSALVPTLLTDRYVIVHRAMARALTYGVPVAPQDVDLVVAALIQLATVYSQPDQDRDVLDDALSGLMRWSGDLSDATAAIGLRRVVAHLARNLDSSDRVRFLRRHANDMRDTPEYVDTLLTALQDEASIHDWNSEDEQLRLILLGIPADLLLPRADALKAAAIANLPRRLGPGLGYIEVFQRIGLWHEAVALAEAAVAMIPLTPESAVQRTLGEVVLASARTEAAIAAGETAEAATRHQEWKAAEGAHARAVKDAQSNTEFPWLT